MNHLAIAGYDEPSLVFLAGPNPSLLKSRGEDWRWRLPPMIASPSRTRRSPRFPSKTRGKSWQPRHQRPLFRLQLPRGKKTELRYIRATDKPLENPKGPSRVASLTRCSVKNICPSFHPYRSRICFFARPGHIGPPLQVVFKIAAASLSLTDLLK